MKPTWEELGDLYAASSSVLIGDADCTVEKEICGRIGVSGYPTIKYFTAETEKTGDAYSGGRDIESLKKHVEDKLAKSCDVSDESTCNEKELKYLVKMTGNAKVTAELARLQGMTGNSMKVELKAWLFQRINILTQLAGKEEL